MAVISGKGREVVRVRGEVVGPEPPMAHPIPRDERGIITAPRVPPLQVVREVHHHYPAPTAAPEPSIRWRMLGAYVFGLLMLLVVLGLLIASGAIDLHALRPPWQETGR